VIKKVLHWKRLLPLSLIITGLFLFFFFDLHYYFTFDSLKMHHDYLLHHVEQHYVMSFLIFMAAYVVLVAISFPGATILSLVGGFLFGTWLGTLYVVIAATVGATLVFLAARSAFHEFFQARAHGMVEKLKSNLEENAFSYLLFLRLVPVFPFFVINVVPALVNIPLRIYIASTFLGIIPGALVYVSVGSGLNHLFAMNQSPNMSIIFEWNILLPILALSILSLVPLIYKKYRRRHGNNSKT
jgi:uncharacterized membrane protein YdjX (TVP38/TMEM64 family)